MNVTGRDGVLESIHEIRSLEVNCRAEGVSRIMNRQLLQMCGSAGTVLQTVGNLAIDPIGTRLWPPDAI